MHCCQAGVAWQGDLRSGGCGGRRRLANFDPGALFPEGCRAPPPLSGTEDDRAHCVVVRLELANPNPSPNPNPNPNPNQVYAANFAVDTFFVLSGFLGAFVLLRRPRLIGWRAF